MRTEKKTRLLLYRLILFTLRKERHNDRNQAVTPMDTTITRIGLWHQAKEGEVSHPVPSECGCREQFR
jgi:hypothetical protein